MTKLKVGDWIEVRSRQEILQTLDDRGQLEGMPFMPEMFQYCGMRFKVFKRAHKTCDYSTAYPYRTRRLKDTVHLETRCDGESHDGCQAGCLLYWKIAWLKALDENDTRTAERAGGGCGSQEVCSPSELLDATRVLANTRRLDAIGVVDTYVCQTTQIPFATTELKWWDIRQYLEDYSSGNVSVWRIVCAVIYAGYFHLSQAGIGLGPAMRWLYNSTHKVWGGTLFPRTPGLIPEGMPTPSVKLNLQPGELVQIKPHKEILQTVDSRNRNRGMFWDAELVPYCGKTYKVLKRVTRIIDEKSSKMIEMKSPCIILDSVVCQARYSQCRMLCPKSMYPYWREAWLQRVEAMPANEAATALESGDVQEMQSR